MGTKKADQPQTQSPFIEEITTKEKIVALIRRDPWITAQQIGDRIGQSKKNIEKCIRDHLERIIPKREAKCRPAFYDSHFTDQRIVLIKFDPVKARHDAILVELLERVKPDGKALPAKAIDIEKLKFGVRPQKQYLAELKSTIEKHGQDSFVSVAYSAVTLGMDWDMLMIIESPRRMSADMEAVITDTLRQRPEIDSTTTLTVSACFGNGLFGSLPLDESGQEKSADTAEIKVLVGDPKPAAKKKPAR